MNLLWLVALLLIVFVLVGAPEIGPWRHPYGFYPSGLGLALLIVLLVVILR